MKVLETCFKQLDYFGQPPTLRIKSEEKFTSAWSGLVFTIWVLGICVYFGYSFNKWITKKNMSLVTSNDIVIPSPALNLSESNFMFATALLYDNYTVALNDFQGVLRIKATFTQQTNKNGIEKTRFQTELHKCLPSDFPVISQESFDSFGLKEYLCPKLVNYTVQGLFTDYLFYYIKLDVEFEPAAILNLTSYNKVKDYLNQGTLRLNSYFVDSAVDVRDTTNPFSHYINSIYTLLDFRTYKRIDALFMKSPFVDDGSILFEDTFTNYSMKFSETKEYETSFSDRFGSLNPDNGRFVSIYIRSSENVLSLTRSYEKVSTFLAKVSSIGSGSLIIISRVMIFINKIKIIQWLVKKTVLIKCDIKNDPEVVNSINRICNETKRRHLLIQTARAENELSQIYSKPEENNTAIQHIRGNKCDNTSEIKISIAERQRHELYLLTVNKNNKKYRNSTDATTFAIIIQKVCCGVNKNKTGNKYYQIGKERVFYYTDILTIIKKFQEVELLKDVVLTKDNRTLFNFLSKPIISLVSEKNLTSELIDYHKLHSSDNSTSTKEISNIINLYKKLQSQESDVEAITQKMMTIVENKIEMLI